MAVPLFYKRARRLAESAARLFHGCGSRARSRAWKTEALDERWVDGMVGASLQASGTRPVSRPHRDRDANEEVIHQRTPTAMAFLSCRFETDFVQFESIDLIFRCYKSKIEFGVDI